MAKEKLTGEELVEKFNAELEKHEESENCKITGILPLRERYEGANWAPPILNCGNAPVSQCQPIAEKIYAELARRYDLDA